MDLFEYNYNVRFVVCMRFLLSLMININDNSNLKYFKQFMFEIFKIAVRLCAIFKLDLPT